MLTRSDNPIPDLRRMRILVVTKRQYMGMDLLDDRFGRFRELPLELNRLGHKVAGLAISYRQRPMGVTLDCDPGRDGCVTWHSKNATGAIMPQLGRVIRNATQLVRDYKPDIIWAASDAYVVTFGTWLAKRFRTCCVVDLYDNFEAFAASKFPGLLPLFRRAVREADGVTFFSRRLAEHVIKTYPLNHPSMIIENGVRKDSFIPQDRNLCRQVLGLPENATIIGFAGALDPSRGIETLFSAYKLLSSKNNVLHLALAGTRQPSLLIPNGARIHDLKILPHQQVPTFINALDLAVICYRQSPQGEVSFPQKAYEIIACRVPLVAAAVGSMNELLTEYPECLYEPENANSLAQAIERQLEARTIVNLRAPSWTDSAKKLEAYFQEVLRGRT
jgi:teichuronic acid biosynthesis glycosyltransferase TuaC